MEKQASTLLPQIASASASSRRASRSLPTSGRWPLDCRRQTRRRPPATPAATSVALAFPPLAGPRLGPARAPELEAVQPGPPAIGAAGADAYRARRSRRAHISLEGRSNGPSNGQARRSNSASSVHPAHDSHVRAVAATLGGMAGRVEEDEPRLMRPLADPNVSS